MAHQSCHRVARLVIHIYILINIDNKDIDYYIPKELVGDDWAVKYCGEAGEKYCVPGVLNRLVNPNELLPGVATGVVVA